jgi:H-type lectin domain
MTTAKTTSPVPAQTGMSAEDALLLAQKDLAEKRRQNNITLVGILVTFLAALISLLWNSRIQKETSHTSEQLQQIRLDTGEAETLINEPGHQWTSWKEVFSPGTVALGISRDVVFSQPFQKPPKVTISLKTLDFPDLASALDRLGFKTSDKATRDAIHRVAVYAEAQQVTEKGFKLCVGLSLTPTADNFLEHRLAEKPLVNAALVQDMRTAGMLERHDDLTPDEVWMINFYNYIGSFTFSWIAQTTEGQANTVNSEASIAQ